MKEANILSTTGLDIELPSSESEGQSDMLSNFASLENLESPEKRPAVLQAAPSEPTLTSFTSRHLKLTIEQVRLKHALVRAKESGCTGEQARQLIDAVFGK
jgi:hypothetical protein